MTSADLPAYTTLDVAKHNSPHDAWIIVGGKVLDITSWVHEHPGGDVVLLDAAGRDATREFEDVGHSADARLHLNKLVIGTVRPATEEELRISKTAGHPETSRKGQASALIADISNWIQAHSGQIKQASAASAVAVFAVFIARRYIVPYFSGSKK